MRPARRGFTLIELLAVLLIMGLVAGLVLPNLSLRSDRVVLGVAEDLAADLAFTRQRAVATGRPHRVGIDLENAAWWLEEWPEEPPPAAPEAAEGDRREVRLVAPASLVQDFRPLASGFGRPRVLPEGVEFASIETLAAGPVVGGRVALLFDPDGSADPALLTLVNEDGDVVRLELSRLGDEIRIRRGE